MIQNPRIEVSGARKCFRNDSNNYQISVTSLISALLDLYSAHVFLYVISAIVELRLSCKVLFFRSHTVHVLIAFRCEHYDAV